VGGISWRYLLQEWGHEFVFDCLVTGVVQTESDLEQANVLLSQLEVVFLV
jgi:hypothetical protein